MYKSQKRLLPLLQSTLPSLELKNCREKELWQFLYHLVLDSSSAFILRPKTHTRSGVLCRSPNNSIWFRFDWNVQHYFVSIRKTVIDIFVALTEHPKKIITHIVTQKTRKILFSDEKATQNFLCPKKTKQDFTCTWPEHWTIGSSWMLKCNASAVVVVVAEKIWISQNMLWLPCSNRMSRW